MENKHNFDQNLIELIKNGWLFNN